MPVALMRRDVLGRSFNSEVMDVYWRRISFTPLERAWAWSLDGYQILGTVE